MKIKAIKPLFYGHGREVGEVFDAMDRYAYPLIRMGKAEAVTSEEKSIKAVDKATDAPKKGRYSRKDMQGAGETK